MSNAGKAFCPRNYIGQLFRLLVPTQINKKKINKKSTTEAAVAKQEY